MPHPVYPLAQLPSELFGQAGGKAGTLARLLQAGFPVPEGAVILPAGFAAGALTPDAWHHLQKWLAGLAPPGAAPPALAVRSSALVEDSAAASYAGAFETVLDVRGAPALRQAIDTVARSGSAARVRAYAAALGQPSAAPAAGVGMAVLVQRLVPADLAGVLFTADPVSGDRARLVGSCVAGLGDRLVSGEVQGQAFELAQPRGRYRGPPALRRFAPRLFRLAQRLEARFGHPLDLEWAVAGGRLWLLQARPITSLRGHNPATGEWNDSLTGDYLWTNTNFGEALPDVMTPATWSAVQLFMQPFMPPPLTPSPQPFFGNIAGRFYFNLALFASLLAAFGLSRRRLAEEMEELYGRLPDAVAIPLLPLRLGTLLRRLPPFILRARWRLLASRRRLPAFLRGSPERVAALRARIAAAPDAPALAAVWTGHLRPAYLRASEMLLAATSRYENLVRPLRRALARQAGPAAMNALLSGLSQGQSHLASLGPLLGLWQLSAGDLSREAYAAEYGHRGPHELELAWPRPSEDPAWIDRQLDDLRRRPVDVPALLARQQARRDLAWQDYAARFPRRAPALRRKLAAAAEAARRREQTRSEHTRLHAVLRAWLLRAGALTGLGDAIFFLSLPEVMQLLGGERAAAAFIPARRATHARYSALPPYPAIIRGRFDPFAWAAGTHPRGDVFDAGAAPDAAAPAAETLTGFAGAAGVVEGTVRVLRAPEDGPALQPGEVLVAATTNIGWTPLFPRAAAVVTDVGAPLSHAAIVARELGVPAVIGTGLATTRLRTGDRVRVDGGRGTVTLLG